MKQELARDAAAVVGASCLFAGAWLAVSLGVALMIAGVGLLVLAIKGV